MALNALHRYSRRLDSIYDIVWARDPETGAEVTYGDVRLHGRVTVLGV